MNILIIYKYISFPIRGTLKDHLYSFYKQGKNNCIFYLGLRKTHNPQKIKIPEYLKKLKLDIIVFHYSFASGRKAPRVNWENTIKEVEFFKKSSALKVLFAQDEMYYTDQLNDFINYYGINLVYTVAPESEWPIIYNKIDPSKTQLVKTLTGFVETKRYRRNERKFGKTKRIIDIGYRARKLPPWLGRHGFRKAKIADVFNKALERTKLVTDISTRAEDTLYGEEWDEFLYKCKYMLGVEGGASVHDPDGSIDLKGYEYIKIHPEYSFEEVEALIFPGKDGNLKLFAISPRNFECCASKTCQVLVEGNYDGILKPDIHYIPIAKDFSNINEVIKKIEDDNLREQIVNTAYNDIIASGNYSYKKFVEDFISTCQQHLPASVTSNNNALYYRLLSAYNYYMDRLSWKMVRVYRFRDKYFNKWYFIEKAKKIKSSNKVIGFSYRALKKIFAFG